MAAALSTRSTVSRSPLPSQRPGTEGAEIKLSANMQLVLARNELADGADDALLPLSPAQQTARSFDIYYAALQEHLAHHDIPGAIDALCLSHPHMTREKVSTLVRMDAAEKFLKAVRRKAMDGFEACLTQGDRCSSRLEASYLASLGRADDEATFSGNVVVASPRQVADCELDYDFAKDLALKLQAEIVNDSFTEAVNESMASLAKKGEKPPRRNAREHVATQILGHLLLGKPRHFKNDGYNTKMTTGDREFATMCSAVLRDQLTNGVMFSKAVHRCIEDTGWDRLKAQNAVALRSMKEIFHSMREGTAEMPARSNIAYEG